MASIEKLLAQLEREPAVAGDPRVNILGDTGKAKLYQVRQVLAAIAKLQGKTK